MKKMLTYIEAPNTIQETNLPTIFLAGGITGCPDWQAEMVGRLNDVNAIVFNPRRKNFPMADPAVAFNQIKWEHDHLMAADIISYWFCSEQIQPIVLFELGRWLASSKVILIGCHPEYKRHQDVVIQSKLEGRSHIFDNLNDLANAISNAVEVIDAIGK